MLDEVKQDGIPSEEKSTKEGDDKPTSGDKDGKIFNQEQLNEVVQGRLKEEKEKHEKVLEEKDAEIDDLKDSIPDEEEEPPKKEPTKTKEEETFEGLSKEDSDKLDRRIRRVSKEDRKEELDEIKGKIGEQDKKEINRELIGFQERHDDWKDFQKPMTDLLNKGRASNYEDAYWLTKRESITATEKEEADKLEEKKKKAGKVMPPGGETPGSTEPVAAKTPGEAVDKAFEEHGVE